jgi:hypothetical protein
MKMLQSPFSWGSFSSVWIIEDTSQCKDKPKTDSRTAPQALGLRPFEDG